MILIEELRRQLEFLRDENHKLRSATNRLLPPLRGIGSCATRCGCCQMHQDVANKAIAEATALLNCCDHDWWHGGERAFCRKCLAERV